MNIEIIERLAKSAKLKFTPEDLKNWSAEMEKIFTWINQLERVDASGVEDAAAGPELFLRPDETRDFENIPAVISAFPSSEENMIKVKKVL